MEEKPNQETLEVAAENYAKDIGNKDGTAQWDFKKGVKWQAERMYSEIEQKWLEYRNYTNNEDAWMFKEWLVEQFKQK